MIGRPIQTNSNCTDPIASYLSCPHYKVRLLRMYSANCKTLLVHSCICTNMQSSFAQTCNHHLLGRVINANHPNPYRTLSLYLLCCSMKAVDTCTHCNINSDGGLPLTVLTYVMPAIRSHSIVNIRLI